MEVYKGEPPLKLTVSTPEPWLDATFDHVFKYWPVLTRRGESRQFQALDEFIDWLRQELAEIEGEPES